MSLQDPNHPVVPGRRAAAIAAAFGLLYLVVYLAVMSSQDSLDEAWPYALAILVPTGLCVVAAATRRVFVPMMIATLLFAFLAFLGLLSIGLLLVPAIVLAAMSAVQARSARDTLASPR